MWDILGPAIDAGATALVGALIAALLAFAPKAWVALGAFVHGKDVLLLRETLANAAQIGVQKVGKGEMSEDNAIIWMAEYVKTDRLPQTVVKLKLTDAALRDMALAAYYRVVTERKAASAP